MVAHRTVSRAAQQQVLRSNSHYFVGGDLAVGATRGGRPFSNKNTWPVSSHVYCRNFPSPYAANRPARLRLVRRIHMLQVHQPDVEIDQGTTLIREAIHVKSLEVNTARPIVGLTKNISRVGLACLKLWVCTYVCAPSSFIIISTLNYN